MRRRRLWIVLISAAVLLVAAVVVSYVYRPRVLYRVTCLPLMGGVETRVHGINDSGQVVCDVRWEKGPVRIVLWNQREGTKDLDSFPPDHTVFALALNDVGEIAGTVIDPNHRWRSFFWDTDGRRYGLDTPARGRTQIVALNNRGQVVGHGDTPQRSGRVFLWDKASGMRDLGTFGGIESLARGINDAGQIVGFCAKPAQQWRAFLYDPNLGTRDLGPTRFGPLATCCINNQGFVVGLFGSAEDENCVSIWTAGTGPHRLPGVGGDLVVVCGLDEANRFLLQSRYERHFPWRLGLSVRNELHLWQTARYVRRVNRFPGPGGVDGLQAHDMNKDGTILGSLPVKDLPFAHPVLLEPIE